jgi:hypothetical protein
VIDHGKDKARGSGTSLRGEVRARGTSAHRFVGWIGLLSALEKAILTLTASEGETLAGGSEREVVLDVELNPLP